MEGQKQKKTKIQSKHRFKTVKKQYEKEETILKDSFLALNSKPPLRS